WFSRRSRIAALTGGKRISGSAVIAGGGSSTGGVVAVCPGAAVVVIRVNALTTRKDDRRTAIGCLFDSVTRFRSKPSMRLEKLNRSRISIGNGINSPDPFPIAKIPAHCVRNAIPLLARQRLAIIDQRS